MRDLTVEEIEMVSGGGWFSQFMDWAGFDGKFGDGGGSGGFFGALGSALGGTRGWFDGPGWQPRAYVEIGPISSDPESYQIQADPGEVSDWLGYAAGLSIWLGPGVAGTLGAGQAVYGIADEAGAGPVAVGLQGYYYGAIGIGP